MSEGYSAVIFGEELLNYSFPGDHPMNRKRLESFWNEFRKIIEEKKIKVFPPNLAKESDLLLFHTKDYVDFVKRKSKEGTGFLDYGDTPAYPGCFESASYVVGATLKGLELIFKENYKHVFVPMAGLHHARRDRASGFCIFNDIGVAINKARMEYGVREILYVDIDAHHGDGVFYEFLEDPFLYIVDIHEDGRFLYPGTGGRHERGDKDAFGTKLNIPLLPGSSDEDLLSALKEVEDFSMEFKTELVILQAGVDGIQNDPITHLNYTYDGYEKFISGIHNLAHKICDGRLLILGGGGYNPENTKNGWLRILKVINEDI
ncbi:MAG: acetoin utilization protein AcuC [Dictyoglomaceae bacterium]